MLLWLVFPAALYCMWFLLQIHSSRHVHADDGRRRLPGLTVDVADERCKINAVISLSVSGLHGL